MGANTMNLSLTADQQDCLIELTKESLYALPFSEVHRIQQYPAFQILEKLRPNDPFVLGQKINTVITGNIVSPHHK